ncbi:MAG: ribosomal protein S18-alanine N-acetyltransferase [Eubacteriales bacterium]|nr:ribosomal protein S18-alanine N-acetyltransferase [Eubacteriales bacterium]
MEEVIRRMEKRDAAQAAAIEQVCFSEPWSREAFEATLLLPYAAYYVAEEAADGLLLSDDGQEYRAEGGAASKTGDGVEGAGSGASEDGLRAPRILGICGVRKIMGEGEITNVAVLPTHRQRGVARRMLERLLSEARQEGVTSFTLEVRSGNTAAIRLYESLGFQVEGRRSRFYRKPEEDALILWRRV